MVINYRLFFVLRPGQLQFTVSANICLNTSIKSERGIIQTPLLTLSTAITLMFTLLLCQTLWLTLLLLKGQRLYYFLCLLLSGATTRERPLVACSCCRCASHQVPRPGVASSLLLFSPIQQLPDRLAGPLLILKTRQIEWVAPLLLITVYCCFLWACPSTDVIKNRNGMNFNQQQRGKRVDTHVC